MSPLSSANRVCTPGRFDEIVRVRLTRSRPSFHEHCVFLLSMFSAVCVLEISGLVENQVGSIQWTHDPGAHLRRRVRFERQQEEA